MSNGAPEYVWLNEWGKSVWPEDSDEFANAPKFKYARYDLYNQAIYKLDRTRAERDRAEQERDALRARVEELETQVALNDHVEQQEIKRMVAESENRKVRG